MREVEGGRRGGGSCKFKGCLSVGNKNYFIYACMDILSMMHVDQGAWGRGSEANIPLASCVTHTGSTFGFRKRWGQIDWNSLGECKTYRMFPYSISTSIKPNPNHTMSPSTMCVPLDVASVDVDRIAREMDFQALQQNIMNITFCNIQSEVKLLYDYG